MRVALLTPLPPSRTGIAHYASMLLPALRERLDVTAFDSPTDYDPAAFDLAVYQLGNNPHHEWIYAAAMRRPGVIVLHDLVLHHLIVEMTLARGDVDGYVEAMRANHGEAGAAWARGRAIGLHAELANFLMPASIDLARRSRAVIVHNRWAAERLKSFGVEPPIEVVPHPYVSDPHARDGRNRTRARLGIADDDRVIGFFGFLTAAKRSSVVLDAFRAARRRDPSLRLLIVGEPSPDIDLASLTGDGVITTGYVDDADFGAYYAAADRLVNLRYPSAGETSGTLIRAFDAGKPVAVSDYAQFAEMPDDCVTKIAFGAGEVAALTDFFLRPLDGEAIAAAQRAWLESHARLDLTIDGYLRAIERSMVVTSRDMRTTAITRTLPLFPRLELLTVRTEHRSLILQVHNTGDFTLRTRTYGQPGYRLLAKLFDGEREVFDRWLALPGDLRPGHDAELTLPLVLDRGETSNALTLRLYDAIEGVAMLEPQPFASVEIAVAAI